MKVRISHKDGYEVVDLNRRKAIRKKCLICSYWNSAEVERCPQTECYLYPFRMGTGKQNAATRDRTIRTYCLQYCMNGQRREVKLCPSRDCPLFAYRLTRLDVSVEIDSESCKGHIEAISEAIWLDM